MKRLVNKLLFVIVILTFLISAAGCSNTDNNSSSTSSNKTKTTQEASDSQNSVNGILKVHFIDVGQGDSELIQQGNKNMLIDTGTNASTDSLISYLQSQNISKIDYLVLTHPHEDHIGGADAIINKFDIGTIYMPKATATTKTFEDVAAAISSKGLKATAPNPGDTFNLGEASCEILSPINTDSDNLNTYSIVLKLTFGNNKFMFTGDAEASNEEDMISKGYDLSADVLKVGHHGSHSSTSQQFLDKVNPKYAVISCGKGNDYGHPHKETMEKLQTKNIPVYRTDESGTIVCTSDGKTITFSCSPGDYKYGSEKNSSGSGEESSSNSSSTSSSGTSINNNSSSQSGALSVGTTSTVQEVSPSTSASSDNQSATVYITKTGKKYHREGCRYLARSQIPISLGDAQSQGYEPCSVCDPPQ